MPLKLLAGSFDLQNDQEHAFTYSIALWSEFEALNFIVPRLFLDTMNDCDPIATLLLEKYWMKIIDFVILFIIRLSLIELCFSFQRKCGFFTYCLPLCWHALFHKVSRMRFFHLFWISITSYVAHICNFVFAVFSIVYCIEVWLRNRFLVESIWTLYVVMSWLYL